MYKMKVVINYEKSLERIVSQKALQMRNSFESKVCVVSVLAFLLVATIVSIGFHELSPFSFSPISAFHSFPPPSSTYHSIRRKRRNDPKSLLYWAWTSLLSEQHQNLEKLGLNESDVPDGPHLENCESRTKSNRRLDTRDGNSRFPPWTGWNRELETFAAAAGNNGFDQLRRQAASRGYYPPWVIGADEENYPLTRKVQKDLWLSQHPLNCSDPSVRFLLADWEREPGFGIGAQIAGMAGLFAIAVNEKRVLVTGFYNRADHDGCNGTFRSSWSCYFLPETSQECRERAFELVRSEEAWKKGIIKGKQNYSSKEIWTVSSPSIWGKPWSFLQPTTEINGSLVAYHRKMDLRWWRAQAVRYLMRFQSEYTCKLMNIARHQAFGMEAASMVVKSLPVNWPKNVTSSQRSNIEDFVWSNHKAWVPRPLLSVHVRMGDKACEMKVVGFEEYMKVAERIRRRFPHLNRIWLSTEMEEVINKSRGYKDWKFYYTKVRRQVGSMTMPNYEASLGRETSTNYPMVNFLMATEADFFIGALGSTWCFLIDGMRNTGGKVMAGYLSVNKDRFW